MTEFFEIVEIALKEDLGYAGDITSRACVPPFHRSKAKVISREDGVIAGIEPFTEVFQAVDSYTEIIIHRGDGDKVAENDIIAGVEGYTRSLLSAERTALNFLGHLSGVATVTNRMVEAVRGSGVVLLDTRKTLPGMRILEKKSVRAGGGYNHRFGLFDMILIKENHIAASGGIEAALDAAQEFNRKVGGRLEIEIEVRNLEELRRAIARKPERIMLDNFTPGLVRQAVAQAGDEILLEVSGGVNIDNIKDYAAAGPDFISIGSITHSAPALNLSMLMEGIY